MKYKYKEAIHREKMCAMISLGERVGVRAGVIQSQHRTSPAALLLL